MFLNIFFSKNVKIFFQIVHFFNSFIYIFFVLLEIILIQKFQNINIFCEKIQ